MTWFDLLPSLLLALILLVLPGLAVTVAAGQRGFAAVALAPAVSISLIALSAIGAGLVGVPWSVLPPLALTAVAALVVGGIRLTLDRRWPDLRVRETWFDAEQGWSWVGAAVGGMLMARHLKNTFDRPDAFSQTFDNVFHLSAIRHIADTGRASSLTLMEINAGPGDSTFYPAAFHDLASLVFPVAPGSLPMALTATLSVLVAIAWPLGVVYLVRSFITLTPVTALGTGVLAASLPAFPVLLLGYGVLYPNLTGLTLLPVVVGLAISILGLGRIRRVDLVIAPGLALLAIPGMALSHPNVLMSLFVVVGPMLASQAIRQLSAARAGELPWGRAAVRCAGLVAAIGVMAATWPFIRPPAEAATWQPPNNSPTSIGQALLNAPLASWPVWVPSILMVIGAIVAWRLRLRWLVWSWLTAAFFWVVVSTPDLFRVRMALTGVWYNDSFRLAALLPVVALPLAALGIHALEHRMRAALPPRRWIAIVACAGVVAALVLTTQRTRAMDAAVDGASALYQVTPQSPLVDSDELTLLLKVPSLVPADAVVATNPWNGSSLLYALTGVRTTTMHILYTPTAEVEEINESLDEAGQHPDKVCPAVRALAVTHVLDFGDREVHGGHHPYEGLLDLAGAPGFTEKARVGKAVLYEITACR